MGQAFDEEGNVLGEAFGDTKCEVFDKLMAEHGEKAHEFRIRKLRESIAENETGTTAEGDRHFEITELLREIRNKLDSLEGYARAWYEGQR